MLALDRRWNQQRAGTARRRCSEIPCARPRAARQVSVLAEPVAAAVKRTIHQVPAMQGLQGFAAVSFTYSRYILSLHPCAVQDKTGASQIDVSVIRHLRRGQEIHEHIRVRSHDNADARVERKS